MCRSSLFEIPTTLLHTSEGSYHPEFSSLFLSTKSQNSRDFPDGPVARTGAPYAGGCGLILGQGTVFHMLQLRSGAAKQINIQKLKLKNENSKSDQLLVPPQNTVCDTKLCDLPLRIPFFMSESRPSSLTSNPLLYSFTHRQISVDRRIDV